jgi:hypothetical protein
MRQSMNVSLITVAAVLSWTIAAHLGLVAAGTMARQHTLAPVCRDIDNLTTACAIVVENDKLTLAGIAAGLREPFWQIIIDNPTLPVGWPLDLGTRVYVSREYPAPPDQW